MDKVKNKGLKLAQVIIVDDSPEKARSNYGNALYIAPFEGGEELKYLYEYMLRLKEVENVRAVEAKDR